MARRRCLFASYFYVKYNGASYDGTLTIPSFDDTGGTAQIEVISYKPWNLKSKPAWITMSTESGNRGKTLVTLTANTNSGSLRSGDIIIAPNTEKYSMTISVSQNENTPGPTYSIEVVWSNNSYEKKTTNATGSDTCKVIVGNQGWVLDSSSLPAGITVSPTAGTATNNNVSVNWNAYDGDRRITFNGTVSGSGYVKLVQQYFYWGNGSQSATTSGVTTTSAQTTTRNTYTSNYLASELSYSTDVDWITGVSFANGEITVYLAPNTTSITDRVGTITIIGNGSNIATYQITQQAAYTPVTYAFAWDDNGETAITIDNISADGATGRSGYACTGYTAVRVGTTPESWLTLSTNGGTNSYLYYTAGTNDTTTARSDYNYIEGQKQDGTWERCGRIDHAQQTGTGPQDSISVEWTDGSSYDWTAPNTSGSKMVTVAPSDSTLGWHLKESPSWVTINPTAGTGTNNNVTVSWDANTGAAKASDFITFCLNNDTNKDDFVKIGQEAGSTSASIDAYFGSQGTTSTGVSSAASYVMATVVTNGQTWGVGSMDGGITNVTPSTGADGTTSIRINYDENPYGFQRESTIVLTGRTSGSVTLTITQNRNNTVPSNWAWFMCYVENGVNETATVGTGTPVEIWAKYADSNFDVHTLTSITASDWVYNGTSTSCSDVSKSGSRFYFESDVTGTTNLQAKYNGYRTSNYVSIEVTGSTPSTPFFYWYDTQGGSTAITYSSTTVSSGQSSFSHAGINGYPNNLTLSASSWLTLSTNSFAQHTSTILSVTASPNPDTTARTGYVWVKNGNTVVGTFEIEQEAKYVEPDPFFYWYDAGGSTAITYSSTTVSSGESSFSHAGINGYPGTLTLSASSWLRLSTNGFAPHMSTILSVTASSNPDTAARTGYIWVKSGSTVVGTFEVEQEAKYVAKTLTAITLSFTNVPTIPCTGGTVHSGDVTYVVTAHYSDSSTEDITNTVDGITGNGSTMLDYVSAPTRGNQPGDTITAGTITYTARYTFNGVTKSASEACEIEQDANGIVSSREIGTGTTGTETHNGTKTGGTVNYSISCSPTAETVNQDSGTCEVAVYAYKLVPTTAFTYDTYYKTTTYEDTLCTGAKVNRTETATTPTSGATAQTSTYTDQIVTGFTASRAYANWNSGATDANGITITYSAYTGTTSRSTVYTFRNAGRSTVTCTFTLTQEYQAQPEPTRIVTIFPTAINVEHSNSAIAEHDIVNFSLGGVGGEGRIDFSNHGIEPGTQNEYYGSGYAQFTGITTAATTVTLEVVDVSFQRAGRFYGVSSNSIANWSDLDFTVSGSGSAIASGNYRMVINVPAGSGTETIYLPGGYNPDAVFDYN